MEGGREGGTNRGHDCLLPLDKHRYWVRTNYLVFCNGCNVHSPVQNI